MKAIKALQVLTICKSKKQQFDLLLNEHTFRSWLVYVTLRRADQRMR